MCVCVSERERERERERENERKKKETEPWLGIRILEKRVISIYLNTYSND